jgi:hypothetical protein
MRAFVEYLLFLVSILVLWLFTSFLEAQGGSREQTLLVYLATFVGFIYLNLGNHLIALKEWVGKAAFGYSKKWYRKLYDGKPINPVHGSIPPQTNLAKFEEELLEFAETFADRVNEWLGYEDPPNEIFGTAWRLQRTGEWHRHDEGIEFKIWFNGQSVGELQLKGWHFGKATAVITIRSARVFSLESIWKLVGEISGVLHCSDEQLEKARQEIRFCALSALWQVGPDATHNPDLVFRLDGHLQDQRPVTELETHLAAH